jgi:hypothetical protein
MQIIPHCEMRQIGNEIICDYTIERWKEVLKADVELVYLRGRVKKEQQRSAELTLQNSALQGQVDAHEDTKGILVERNDKLVKDILDIDKKYQLERVKPRWGSPVAWTVAATAAALLIGYVANDKL